MEKEKEKISQDIVLNNMNSAHMIVSKKSTQKIDRYKMCKVQLFNMDIKELEKK